jgi:hypothetical protein
MKKILVLFTMIPWMLNCCKYDSFPKAEFISNNPTEDYPWLKVVKNSLTNCSCEISILQGTYKGRTVFFTAITDALCDGISMPSLYDCEGKIVRIFNSDDFLSFHDLVTTDKVLYRCQTTI